jgi:phospholipase C
MQRCHGMVSVSLIPTAGVCLLVLAPACGSQPFTASADGGSRDAGGGSHRDDSGGDGAHCGSGEAFCSGKCIDVTTDDVNCGGCGVTCMSGQHCAAATCQASKIEHVVLIVQENHTFDAYFGKYCQAPTGSNPTCTSGPACCEAAPATEPHGAAPIVLDDTSNFAEDRDHAQACELQQIDDGTMDDYVTGASGSDLCLGSGPSCSSANNWALADATTVGAYWSLADNGALADRYFQPIAASSSSNDMYLAIAHYQFLDDQVMPDAIGCLLACSLDSVCLSATKAKYTGRTTIADLLLSAGKTFTAYADGYAEAVAAGYGNCPNIAADCQYDEVIDPIAYQACRYDASDIPFAYYAQFADGPHIADISQLAVDIANQALPSFAYVKGLTTRNEHPNVSNITDGITFVEGVIQTISQSPYSSSTLVLVTWDEGGGFFDHVAPPPSIDTDDSSKPVPYGTRVPLLAVGPFAKKGTVSHVTMEHSSVVRFLEYNFIGPVGQLGYNDAKVNNLGSLLDPSATGVPIPEH